MKEITLEELLSLISELVDLDSDCRFNGRGHCVEHDFIGIGDCPHAQAKELLENPFRLVPQIRDHI